ncbi:hypothetical protein EXE43_25860, partial [Halorubrum sp. SS5]
TYLDRSDVEFDDFGTAVGKLEDVDGDLRVPSLTADGDRVSRSVEAVSKHDAPNHLVRVRTESGRSITVTPDHGVHVYDDERDEVASREARELDANDRLVIPHSIGSDDISRDP